MEQEKLIKLMEAIEGIGYRLLSLNTPNAGRIVLTLVRKGLSASNPETTAQTGKWA
jgi:hypothetical protein